MVRTGTDVEDAGAKLLRGSLEPIGKFCAGFILLFWAVPAFASIGYTSPGNPAGYVTDFAKVLSANEIQSIDAELQQFEASTSNQIAVVTVPDMNGDYIEDYAPKLFAQWGIGQKSKDNGVLLLLSIQEHSIRIEVGYGLEGALPDSVAQSIINTDLTPNLKAGNYDAGVTAAVSDIMLATQNEYTGTGSTSSNSDNNLGSVIGYGFFFGFIALQWLAAILARSKSWWAGGIVGAVIGFGVWGFFGFVILWGVLAVAGLTGLGLLFDWYVSKHYNAAKANGTRMPWWIGGGGFGGRGGGGGGFGGFGGGMSGGGGASGGW